MEHTEIVRRYGPWVERTPRDAAALLEGYPHRWWIAGGRALDPLTGGHRAHADLDIAIPRSDLGLLRDHLDGVLDLWAAHGALTPLLPGDRTEPPAEADSVWLRPSGADPWEYEVILTAMTPQHWTFKRDDRIRLPSASITWTVDGIEYLRPEIQLLHKARGLRPKDQHDFDACAPLLSPVQRQWLRAALELSDPGHRWIDLLDGTGVTA